MSREEVGIFSLHSYPAGDSTDRKEVVGFNSWINERLAAGARVKSVTQCAGGAERLVVTTITVVLEYP